MPTMCNALKVLFYFQPTKRKTEGSEVKETSPQMESCEQLPTHAAALKKHKETHSTNKHMSIFFCRDRGHALQKGRHFVGAT